MKDVGSWNQGRTVEVTVVQKPNQGVWRIGAGYPILLDFLVLFYQEKST